MPRLRNEQTPFKERDPFNPENEVEGVVLCDQGTHPVHYGDLVIEKVNGQTLSHPQMIIATPKFFYPGDHESPKNVTDKFVLTDVNVYNKFDGTNILAYQYHDAEGKMFITYKTRLRPFLKPSIGYGDFLAKWQYALKKHPHILEIVNAHIAKYNIAFEMYGILEGLHSIKYKEELEAQLIYGIERQTRCVVDPKVFYSITPLRSYACYTFDDYKRDEFTLDRRFKEKGDVEGIMLYSNEGVFKCKAPSILEIQSEGNRHLSIDEIQTTALNAIESTDTMDELLDETLLLLKEVWNEFEIDLRMTEIKKVVDLIKEGIRLQTDILGVYNLCPHKTTDLFEFEKKKREIMRWMSLNTTHKPTDVYNALLKGLKLGTIQ